jgi:tetratricopeptide (TPR) repeat protein
MFAHSVPRYGYYLLPNEQSKEAIQCFEESLKKPYFINDFNSLCTVYVLLTMAYMHCGDMDNAERCCYKALQYESPINFGLFISCLLEEIKKCKQDGDRLDLDYLRSELRTGSNCLDQQLLPKVSILNILPNVINEETCTIENFIMYADYHRYREDFSSAEIFYKKALEKITEIDSQSIWNAFKKIIKMNTNDYDRYRDYFIEQYSKYDENNPNHFEIIAVLQIILYKFSLFQNEFQLAFDFLIYGTFMTIKIIYYKINIDSNYIPNKYRFELHSK